MQIVQINKKLRKRLKKSFAINSGQPSKKRKTPQYNVLYIGWDYRNCGRMHIYTLLRFIHKILISLCAH